MPHALSSGTELHVALRSNDDVALARADARRFAAAAGVSGRSLWEFVIAASEAASNVVKHADGGMLHFRFVPTENAYIEFEAEDNGPGIDPRFLEDGMSSVRDDLYPFRSRGLGCGLQALSRLTDHVSIVQRDEGGTRIICRKFLPSPVPGNTPKTNPRLENRE